jgi:thiamine biosynthesis lipoprotein
VFAVHPDRRYAAQAAQAAFDVVDRLERDLSRFLANSDVSRINRLAKGARTPVSGSTLECLTIARHLFELTAGAFDVSIGTGLAALHLDADHVQVHATTDGVHIDLGGIGKGYAVDVMAEVLEEWGLPIALVHGGFCSVRALDAPAGCEGWPLTLSDPGEPSRMLAHLSIRQAALGASGLRQGAHIVDPHTGCPAREHRAAWVHVPRPETTDTTPSPRLRPAANDGLEAQFRFAPAAVSDALATACMVLSADAIASLCHRSPGMEAWVLRESGFETFGPMGRDSR